MSTMQALQWDGKQLAVHEVPVPVPAKGEALVRVTRAGICNTDLEIIRGYYPFSGTLGHEFTGVVTEAEDSGLVGQRIVADINHACGACAQCLAGHPHHCQHRTALGIKGRDGAFAEYLVTPVANLVAVPDQVTDAQAVFAEPLAAALEIQEQLNFSTVAETAVIGDGKLGLLIALSLARSGIQVTLVGHHCERAALPGFAGITYLDTKPDRQFPLVVEATGSPQGFAEAVQLTAPRGTLVLKSTYKDALTFNAGPVVVNELTLIGSRCGPMDRAMAMMAAGRIDPSVLVTETFPLNEGVAAVARAGTQGTLKVLLSP